MSNKIYSGKTVLLRPVEVSDYEFVHSLRVAPKSLQFLSPVDNDPLQQKAWLYEYKKREEAGTELYCIIQRLDNNEPVGSLRAYNMNHEASIVNAGSWIINDNKTLTSAIESILLMVDLLNDLGFESIIIDARKDNKSALRFIKKISQRFHSEDETNEYYVIDVPIMRSTFYKDNEHYISHDAPQKDA